MKKKINIGINYIVMLVLTTTLLITLSYGWYISNDSVSANGIMASTSTNDIKILKHEIYKEESFNVDNPYSNLKAPDGTPNLGLPGLLIGDKFYYTISIQTKDTKKKNIIVDAMDIDGGEFFTIRTDNLIKKDENHILIDSNEIYETTIKVKTSTGKYESKNVKYKLYKEANDPYLPKELDGTPISNGLFYNTDLSGNYVEGLNPGVDHFRNYIYQKNGVSLNTCDLYKIKLLDAFSGSEYTKLDLVNVDNAYKKDYNAFERKDKSQSRIERKTLAVYNKWVPKTNSDILTLRFELIFDTSSISGLGISQSSLSNKNFIMNNIVVRSQEVA